MRFLLVIILALALGGGGAYAWVYYGGFAGEGAQAIVFVDVYGAYKEVADRVELLVHAPGTEGNNSRAELEKLLTTMLTEQVTDEHRLELAELALTHLQMLKHEVDEAQSAQAQVYEQLQVLDNTARAFQGVQLREQAETIVALARKRTEHASRITSTLSETYDETATILSTIIKSEGALSDEHVTSINEATSHAEERHETLTELYGALVQGRDALGSAFERFVRVAL